MGMFETILWTFGILFVLMFGFLGWIFFEEWRERRNLRKRIKEDYDLSDDWFEESNNNVLDEWGDRYIYFVFKNKKLRARREFTYRQLREGSTGLFEGMAPPIAPPIEVQEAMLSNGGEQMEETKPEEKETKEKKKDLFEELGIRRIG